MMMRQPARGAPITGRHDGEGLACISGGRRLITLRAWTLLEPPAVAWWSFAIAGVATLTALAGHEIHKHRQRRRR